MSIKILPITDTSRLILFLLISILLHISIIFIIPKAGEKQDVPPKLIPVDVIESGRPAKEEIIKEKAEERPKEEDIKKKAEEKPEKKEEIKEVKKVQPIPKPIPSPPKQKIVKKTQVDEAKPLKEDSLKVTEQKSVEEKEPSPAEHMVKEEKPVALFPTQERLSELSKEYEKQTPSSEKGKDLSFDSSEPRYTSYLEGLKGKIYHEWEYPAPAVRHGETGKLYIRFTVLKDGTLESVELLRSSGYPMLDNAALEAIRLAAPYYAFPETFGSLERITINASFEYVLQIMRSR